MPHYHHYRYWQRVDELERVQKMQNRIMHAARLRKIQEATDLVSPLEEAELLTEQLQDELKNNPPIILPSPASKKKALKIKELELENMKKRDEREEFMRQQNMVMGSPIDNNIYTKPGSALYGLPGTPVDNNSRASSRGFGAFFNNSSRPVSSSASADSKSKSNPKGKIAPTMGSYHGDEEKAVFDHHGDNLDDFSRHTEFSQLDSFDSPIESNRRIKPTMPHSPGVGVAGMVHYDAQTEEGKQESQDFDSHDYDQESLGYLDEDSLAEEEELARHEDLGLHNNPTNGLLLPPKPPKKTWLSYICGQSKPKPRILGKILKSRVEALKIKSEVQLIEDDEEKEVYLLKCFILEQLTSYRRAIAERYLIGEGRYLSPKHVFRREMQRWVSMFILPAMWIAIIYYIYAYNLYLGSRTSTTWVTITFIALVIDVLILQPLRIWLKWIVINSVVTEDVREIVHGLKTRFISILTRRAGVMRVDASTMIQHFNPCCRIARLFPHLPTSRFLFSLNDSDVPYALKKPGGTLGGKTTWKAWLFYTLITTIPTTLLIWVTSLPAPIQDGIVEFGATMVLNVVLLILYALSLINPFLAAVIVLGLVGLIVLREMKITAQEFGSKQAALEEEEKINDQFKLEQLYGTPGPSRANTANSLNSPGDGSVMSQVGLSPIRGSTGKAITTITEEDDDEDGAKKNAVENDEDQPPDLIGDFVKEMHAMPNFTNRFGIMPGELTRNDAGSIGTLGGSSLTGSHAPSMSRQKGMRGLAPFEIGGASVSSKRTYHPSSQNDDEHNSLFKGIVNDRGYSVSRQSTYGNGDYPPDQDGNDDDENMTFASTIMSGSMHSQLHQNQAPYLRHPSRGRNTKKILVLPEIRGTPRVGGGSRSSPPAGPPPEFASPIGFHINNSNSNNGNRQTGGGGGGQDPEYGYSSLESEGEGGDLVDHFPVLSGGKPPKQLMDGGFDNDNYSLQSFGADTIGTEASAHPHLRQGGAGLAIGQVNSAGIMNKNFSNVKTADIRDIRDDYGDDGSIEKFRDPYAFPYNNPHTNEYQALESPSVQELNTNARGRPFGLGMDNADFPDGNGSHPGPYDAANGGMDLNSLASADLGSILGPQLAQVERNIGKHLQQALGGGRGGRALPRERGVRKPKRVHLSGKSVGSLDSHNTNDANDANGANAVQQFSPRLGSRGKGGLGKSSSKSAKKDMGPGSPRPGVYDDDYEDRRQGGNDNDNIDLAVDYADSQDEDLQSFNYDDSSLSEGEQAKNNIRKVRQGPGANARRSKH